MPVEEQLAYIFEVIEGGKAVETAEIIQFPVDAGATALEGTTTTATLGNGVATEVSQLTVVEGGASSTAGVGLLAMDVGAVGLAIAPALGILAGVGLYSLAPEFWTNVSNSLVNAGQTVGGKVRAFLNADSKTVGFSEETIEIFKQAFIDAGLFEPGDIEEIPSFDISNYEIATPFSLNVQNSPYDINEGSIKNITFSVESMPIMKVTLINNDRYQYAIVGASATSFTGRINYIDGGYDGFNSSSQITYDNKLARAGFRLITENNYNLLDMPSTTITTSLSDSVSFNYFKYLAWCMLYGYTIPPELQPGATYPTNDSISITYPTWTPYTLPDGTSVYPIEIPEQNPDSTQSTAQNPDEIPDNDNILEWLLDVFPQPAPNPNPYPEPEPEPIEEPAKPDTDPNPIDPNPDPPTPVIPIIPDIPDTVPANAMFTVYKPTIAQVNSFGGWLWTNNIMEAIKRVWQNPLDGIISFMKVYVDAPTSGSDTIKVGMLDSEVTSAVVSTQFVTIDCGSISINEKFFNATDYSPFVSLYIYLPFIGVTELDIDEFMNGEIKVVYHVDVYTGTCLAEIKGKRSYDKPEWTIIYTYSGNASQQLPLTSASFSGAISSLVSVVGGGLAVASGGGLGMLAGASGLAHAVNHEMIHLSHSGSLSANAGIMGARKPFLIITRRRGYDANSYNKMYGYPSNKTVFLNNCSGLVKVKKMRLKTSATDSENKEIENLLKSGVII